MALTLKFTSVGYTDEQIKQAELNLKGYAPIIKEYSGFIVLAHTMQDYRNKCSKILRGDRNGFYTIKRALEMASSENSNCTIHSVVRSCYWCNVPITDNDEVDELPEGRGEAHKKCADEWYGCQMAED